jgi:hypothetical protein
MAHEESGHPRGTASDALLTAASSGYRRSQKLCKITSEAPTVGALLVEISTGAACRQSLCAGARQIRFGDCYVIA